MTPRPAIVSTVRDAARVLDSFIAYHLAIGFAHIYLFFDDPADPYPDRLEHPRVTAIRGDAGLRERWKLLRSWPVYQQHIQTEVMARQILNCELAVDLASGAGFDWLLHIDSDELFWCENGSAVDHFAALDFRGTRNALYLNFEALPENVDIGDYFREVTLFKVNVNRLGLPRFTPEQMALMRDSCFTDEHFNFHLYNNGKSAARIDSTLVPDTVHEFARLRPDNSLDRTREICGDSQLILHYPNCGYTQFVTKYRTLGSFGDKWFGTSDVFPFHRDARNVVAQGDETRIRQFYSDRVMLNETENLERLIANGILRRIPGPADMLRTIARRDP